MLGDSVSSHRFQLYMNLTIRYFLFKFIFFQLNENYTMVIDYDMEIQ